MLVSLVYAFLVGLSCHLRRKSQLRDCQGQISLWLFVGIALIVRCCGRAQPTMGSTQQDALGYIQKK